jgi:hypothetical protein
VIRRGVGGTSSTRCRLLRGEKRSERVKVFVNDM